MEFIKEKKNRRNISMKKMKKIQIECKEFRMRLKLYKNKTLFRKKTKKIMTFKMDWNLEEV